MSSADSGLRSVLQFARNPAPGKALRINNDPVRIDVGCFNIGVGLVEETIGRRRSEMGKRKEKRGREETSKPHVQKRFWLRCRLGMIDDRRPVAFALTDPAER